ncbi:MAG: hypothetical protein HFI35_11660, partial [Roseburia sp.]|nr:hypothetical protein [Roseburia sp.]
MYEYARKAEYAPARDELEKLIHDIQNRMQKQHNMSFFFRQMGSGRKHLITKKRWEQGGFEFNYVFILQNPRFDEYKAHIVQQNFMDAFREALKGIQYSMPVDTAYAITIQAVDRTVNKNRYSCHFSILYYGSQDGVKGFFYLRYNTILNLYEFSFSPLTTDTDKKAREILQEGGWVLMRKEYLKLKNVYEAKETAKPSYSIYAEALNNVYNWIFKQKITDGLLPEDVYLTEKIKRIKEEQRKHPERAGGTDAYIKRRREEQRKTDGGAKPYGKQRREEQWKTGEGAKPYGKQRGEEQRKTDGGAKPYGKQRGEEQRKTDGGAKPYGK